MEFASSKPCCALFTEFSVFSLTLTVMVLSSCSAADSSILADICSTEIADLLISFSISSNILSIDAFVSNNLLLFCLTSFIVSFKTSTDSFIELITSPNSSLYSVSSL